MSAASALSLGRAVRFAADLVRIPSLPGERSRPCGGSRCAVAGGPAHGEPEAAAAGTA